TVAGQDEARLLRPFTVAPIRRFRAVHAKVGRVQAVIPINDIGPLLVVVGTGQPEEQVSSEAVAQEDVKRSDDRNAGSRISPVKERLSRNPVEELTRDERRAVSDGGVQTGRVIPPLVQEDEARLQAVADRKQARRSRAKLAVLQRVRRIAAGLDDVEVCKHATEVVERLCVDLKEAAGLGLLAKRIGSVFVRPV